MPNFSERSAEIAWNLVGFNIEDYRGIANADYEGQCHILSLQPWSESEKYIRVQMASSPRSKPDRQHTGVFSVDTVVNDGALSVCSPTFFDNAAYMTIGKSTGSSAKLKLSTGATAGGLTLVFNRSSDSISVATLVVEWDSVLRRFTNSLSIGTTDIGPSGDDLTIDIDAPSIGKVTVNILAANAVGGKILVRLKSTKNP